LRRIEAGVESESLLPVFLVVTIVSAGIFATANLLTCVVLLANLAQPGTKLGCGSFMPGYSTYQEDRYDPQ
jgi:hypothetical protein